MKLYLSMSQASGPSEPHAANGHTDSHTNGDTGGMMNGGEASSSGESNEEQHPFLDKTGQESPEALRTASAQP